MPTAKLNIPLPSRGLVVDRPAEYVDPQSATNNKNMELDRNVIRKRRGTESMGATLSERVMRYFELTVGASTRLIRVGGTKVEAFNKSSEVWSDVANSALTAGADDIVDFGFPLLSGAKIATFTNGIDAVRKIAITSDDADLGGSPPLARYLLSFGGYLLLAYVVDGGNTFESRVQWSDSGDIEEWSTGNAGSEDLVDDPEQITGLGLFSRFVTVHKPNSIYLGQLTSTGNVFRFDRKSTGVGTVAGPTIANLPSGEQIFLATDGLHLFNGITAPLIESPIQEELRESMNPNYARRSQAIFIEELDEYWVCVATGSDANPQDVYKYNWRTRQVYKDKRTNLTAIGQFRNTQDDAWSDRTLAWLSDTTRWNSVSNLSLNPVAILGDSSGVSTKRSSNTNDDNGTAVEGLFETKDFTAQDYEIPDMDTVMRWQGLEIWAKGDSVKVEYSTDSGSSWTTIETVTLSADYPPDTSPLEIYFDVVSTKLRLRYQNSVSGEIFHLKKYQLEAVPREQRK